MKNMWSICGLLLTILIISLSASTNSSTATSPTATPSFDSENRCVLPCWNNIIPNQTLWTDAKQILEKLGMNISQPYKDIATGLTNLVRRALLDMSGWNIC